MTAKRRRPATEPQLHEVVVDAADNIEHVHARDSALLSELKDKIIEGAVTRDSIGGKYMVVRVSESGAAPAKKATAPRIGAIKVAADAAEVYEVTPKLANAIRVLGNNTVADLLGVSRSQPGRWARGEEGINPENQAAILDLDFVLSVLLRTMPSSLAGIWLVSPNAFLNGARPVDAFRIEGHRRVVEAIQAYAEGAFA